MTPDTADYHYPHDADAALIVAMRNDIPALLSQLREQRERADHWRQRAEEAEECIVWVKCDDPEHERLAALATENQAMRGYVVAALRELGIPGPNYPAPVANAVDLLNLALASLPPVAPEGENETTPPSPESEQ